MKYSTTVRLLVSYVVLALMTMGTGVSAFQVQSISSIRSIPTTTTTTSLNVFGNKKSSSSKAEELAKKEIYWQGEWVCKDCGYIYQRVSSQWMSVIIIAVIVFHSLILPLRCGLVYFVYPRIDMYILVGSFYFRSLFWIELKIQRDTSARMRCIA